MASDLEKLTYADLTPDQKNLVDTEILLHLMDLEPEARGALHDETIFAMRRNDYAKLINHLEKHRDETRDDALERSIDPDNPMASLGKYAAEREAYLKFAANDKKGKTVT